MTYEYDEVGRLAKKKFQNGMCSRYRYDQKGQHTSQPVIYHLYYDTNPVFGSQAVSLLNFELRQSL